MNSSRSAWPSRQGLIMKIKTIKMVNYGPFNGSHELDFTTSGRKNIILIGGLNGSGKSSIFMGLKLCLYGRASLGYQISQKDYSEHLRKLIHEGDSLLENSEASIEVTFDISTAGQVDSYLVRRIWKAKEKSVAEAIEITRNNSPLDVYEQAQWQEFIQHLIPQGMLDLFFFDGEKIGKLTAQTENIQLSQSVQTLFGLNTVRQLKSDLRYIERGAAKGVPEDLKHALEKAFKDLELKEKELELVGENLAELRTKKDIKTQQVKHAEQNLHIKGGMVGVSRKGLQENISKLQEEAENIRKELIALFQTDLPFAYSGEYLEHSIKALSTEEERRSTNSFIDVFLLKVKHHQVKLEDLLKSKKNLMRLVSIFDDRGIAKAEKSYFEDLSLNSIRETSFWFSGSAMQKKGAAEKLATKLDAKVRAITDTHSKLEHVPDEEDIKGEIVNINALYKDIGALEAEIAQKEETQSKLINDKRAAERNNEEAGKRLDEFASKNRQSSLISKTIESLTEFESELVRTKIKTLESNFLACFNQLLRKGDILKSITIDPGTFSVILKNKLDREVDLEKTSEGEKQIYAISLLHSITKTSNCSFPIIIDTPMGRLDGTHKNNLVESYFPHASHQVVILSTDTEIAPDLREKLKPCLAKEYTLQFNVATSSTSVLEGFFEKELA